MLRLLVTFFSDLKGLISEVTRAMIVRRFCRLMSSTLPNDTEESPRKLWLGRDQTRFIRECQIDDTVPKIPNVPAGVVNAWADKWLHVNKFRVKGDGEWRPITPEQNALRVTMIRDLKNMQENELTTAKTDGSIEAGDN